MTSIIKNIEGKLEEQMQLLCQEMKNEDWVCLDPCWEKNVNLITYKMDKNIFDVFGKYLTRILNQRKYLLINLELVETKKSREIINKIQKLKDSNKPHHDDIYDSNINAIMIDVIKFCHKISQIKDWSKFTFTQKIPYFNDITDLDEIINTYEFYVSYSSSEYKKLYDLKMRLHKAFEIISPGKQLYDH